MSSQRSRANKSLGNKLNSLQSQINQTASATVVPATNSVGEDAIQPESIGPGALQAGAADSRVIGRGAVGTENLGVVSGLTSDGDMTLTIPGALYIQPSTVGPPSMLLPVGMVVPFAGYQYMQTEPYGWLMCDGGAVLRTDYPLLFAAIGTRYGAGNGTTTFNLPNLINRYPHGAGLVSKNLGNSEVGLPGSTGGEVNHTLTVAEMPSHTHTQNAHTHSTSPHEHDLMASSSTLSWASVFSAGTNRNGPRGATSGDTSMSTSDTVVTVNSATATNQNAGGGQNHNVMAPYVAMYYLVKAL